MRDMSFGRGGFSRRARLVVLASGSALVLAACEGQPLDFDLRGLNGGFSTANAATAPVAARPKPDNRGVISYPNYQVAVAQRGDTLADVAARVGSSLAQLAKFNGIAPDVPLRKGEIIALPNRVAEPSPATGATTTGPAQPVDITALAGGAINNAAATPGVQTTALPRNAKPAGQPGEGPVRHRVERGETAFTVARLYGVPVKALAEWNSLGAEFKIREGQFLLIPVALQSPPKPTTAAAPLPGVGSPTPEPPSSSKPLPNDSSAVPKPAATKPEKPVADVGKTTKPAKSTKMTAPVQGSIIRAYSKGKNEGVNIKGNAGGAVKAAESGTVAAITKSADGVPIVVVRHAGNLLTVYANVTDVSVSKGASVKRGQQIAKLRDGNDAYVHFEVRKGFDSVDPAPFIN